MYATHITRGQIFVKAKKATGTAWGPRALRRDVGPRLEYKTHTKNIYLYMMHSRPRCFIAHICVGDGGQGCTCPLKFGKIYFGQLHVLCEILAFSCKNHVKLGNFVNFRENIMKIRVFC